jgi:hypothetical protein
LSPVVAAIILIAVTVAVSIAVAAWMGALTFTFMETEQLTYTEVDFGTVNTTIALTVENTGTSDVVVTKAKVIGYGVDETITVSDGTVGKGSSKTITLTLASGEWTDGRAYDIELLTSKGNKFTTRETA